MRIHIVLGLLLWLLALSPALGQRQRATKWESGELDGNQKVGVWEYYSYAANGQQLVTQKYDHSAGKLLYCRPDGKEYLTEVAPNQWENVLLTQPPWCVGGYETLAAAMGKLRYPASAESHNVQGRVVVSFVIDTLGAVSGHRVVQGIGYGCDQEALRVAQSMKALWVPGRFGSRALPTVYELPFTFRLK